MDAGWNVVVRANCEKIVDAVISFKPPAAQLPELYGDGRAGERIVSILSRK